MATGNQLRARLPPSHAKHIESIAEDEFDGAEAEAERQVVKEGLESLGYVDPPTDPHEVLLYHVRRIGLLLGFVGLIAIGYGIFGPRTYSLIGLGMTIIGFLLIALEETLGHFTESRLTN